MLLSSSSFLFCFCECLFRSVTVFGALFASCLTYFSLYLACLHWGISLNGWLAGLLAGCCIPHGKWKKRSWSDSKDGDESIFAIFASKSLKCFMCVSFWKCTQLIKSLAFFFWIVPTSNFKCAFIDYSQQIQTKYAHDAWKKFHYCNGFCACNFGTTLVMQVTRF